jgi:hypothetical protein
MRHRSLVGLASVPAVLLPMLLACTAGNPHSAPEGSGSPRPVKPTSAVSTGLAQPPVAQTPELDGGETLVAKRGETKGGGAIEFAEGKKGDALVVAVRCEGRGEISVKVESVGVEFPLECLKGEVTTTYNQIGVQGVEKAGTVSVEAPSAVRWSMTIGRGEAAETES